MWIEGANKCRSEFTPLPENDGPSCSSHPHIRMLKYGPYLRGFFLPSYMEILFSSWMLTECDQIPGVGVDPAQCLLNVINIFLTKTIAPWIISIVSIDMHSISSFAVILWEACSTQVLSIATFNVVLNFKYSTSAAVTMDKTWLQGEDIGDELLFHNHGLQK